jgi:hypothetical protein
MIGPSMMGVSVVILLVAMLGGSALAKLQGWRHISGAIVFPVGVTIVIPQGDGLVAIPVIGSVIVAIALAALALVGFRSAATNPAWSLFCAHPWHSQD